MPTGIHGIRIDEIRTVRPERIQETTERRNPQGQDRSGKEQKRRGKNLAPEEERNPAKGEAEGRVDILA